MLRARSQQGFTLVEIIIAMALFSIFLIGVVGSFAAILKVHAHSIAAREAQTTGRVSTDEISRLIREAGEACISYSGTTCVKGNGDTIVLNRFTTIFLSGGRLILRRNNEPDTSFSDTPLTDPTQVTVSALTFAVPNVPVPYVTFSFIVNPVAGSGLGPEWKVNDGNGLTMHSTVTLRGRP